VTPWGVSTIPPQRPPTPYNKTMIKTTSGIIASTPELAAIGEQYVQQVIAENKRRQAIRDAAAADQQEWFSKWEATRPQGTYGTWNISDRD